MRDVDAGDGRLLSAEGGEDERTRKRSSKEQHDPIHIYHRLLSSSTKYVSCAVQDVA